MTDKKTTTRKRRSNKSTSTRKRKSPAKKTATKKVAKKKFDADAFYKKYKHVVKGSVRDVEVGKTVDGLLVAHPRICKIKCKESGKLRTIHTQDAHQCFYTREVQAERHKTRAAKRRQSKKKATTKRKSAKAA